MLACFILLINCLHKYSVKRKQKLIMLYSVYRRCVVSQHVRLQASMHIFTFICQCAEDYAPVVLHLAFVSAQ